MLYNALKCLKINMIDKYKINSNLFKNLFMLFYDILSLFHFQIRNFRTFIFQSLLIRL